MSEKPYKHSDGFKTHRYVLQYAGKYVRASARDLAAAGI